MTATNAEGIGRTKKKKKWKNSNPVVGVLSEDRST